MSGPRIRVPTLQQVVEDPIGTAVGVATQPFRTTLEATAYVANQLPTAFGADSLTNQVATAKENEAKKAEDDARAANVNAALSDKSIDAVTRQELLKLYQTGGSSADIADKLNQARQGKGVYGVRQLNLNLQKLNESMPGRSQVLGTGGTIK